MKISTKGKYALEAVVDLIYYAKGGHESLKNISDRLDISKNYLEQIFVVLRQNGLVDSVRGAQGGYKLAKEASKISAGDVIRAVEGSLSPVSCIDEGKCNQPCGNFEDCVTRGLWQNMLGEINKVVDSVTLEDLVESYSQMQKEEAIEYFI